MPLLAIKKSTFQPQIDYNAWITYIVNESKRMYFNTIPKQCKPKQIKENPACPALAETT
jgi:hypothetical protein